MTCSDSHICVNFSLTSDDIYIHMRFNNISVITNYDKKAEGTKCTILKVHNFIH